MAKFIKLINERASIIVSPLRDYAIADAHRAAFEHMLADPSCLAYGDLRSLNGRAEN